MNMANALLDGTIVANAVEIFVLPFKPLVVVEPLDEFFSEANNIPVVATFSGHNLSNLIERPRS